MVASDSNIERWMMDMLSARSELGCEFAVGSVGLVLIS